MGVGITVDATGIAAAGLSSSSILRAEVAGKFIGNGSERRHGTDWQASMCR